MYPREAPTTVNAICLTKKTLGSVVEVVASISGAYNLKLAIPPTDPSASQDKLVCRSNNPCPNVSFDVGSARHNPEDKTFQIREGYYLVFSEDHFEILSPNLFHAKYHHGTPTARDTE